MKWFKAIKNPILLFSILLNCYLIYKSLCNSSSSTMRRNRENKIELHDLGLEYNSEIEKTFEISILHIFELGCRLMF